MKGQGEIWAIFILLGIIAMFIIVIVGLAGLRDIGSYDGEHTGIITAVEHRSNIIWSADIVYFKTDATSTQEDIYCIQKDLVDKAKIVSSGKQVVTIHFHNDFFMWAWDCNGGDSIIDSIGWVDKTWLEVK